MLQALEYLRSEQSRKPLPLNYCKFFLHSCFLLCRGVEINGVKSADIPAGGGAERERNAKNVAVLKCEGLLCAEESVSVSQAQSFQALKCF